MTSGHFVARSALVGLAVIAAGCCAARSSSDLPATRAIEGQTLVLSSNTGTPRSLSPSAPSREWETLASRDCFMSVPRAWRLEPLVKRHGWEDRWSAPPARTEVRSVGIISQVEPGTPSPVDIFMSSWSSNGEPMLRVLDRAIRIRTVNVDGAEVTLAQAVDQDALFEIIVPGGAGQVHDDVLLALYSSRCQKR